MTQTLGAHHEPAYRLQDAHRHAAPNNGTKQHPVDKAGNPDLVALAPVGDRRI